MRKDHFNPTDAERAQEWLATSVDDLQSSLKLIANTPRQRNLVEQALQLAIEGKKITKIKLLTRWLKAHPKLHPVNDAFNEWLETAEGKDCRESAVQPGPFLNNRLQAAFECGWFACERRAGLDPI